MGSFFDSKGQSIADPGAQDAWNIAKPTAQYANTAGTQFTQGVMDNPAYSGPRVAGLNGYQTTGANTLGNFSTANAGTADFATRMSQMMASAGADYGDNAKYIFGQASSDPTAYALSVANQYANDPSVTGMIDAANRDTQRGLTENTLPSLGRAFAGTGNTNSTRAGVESAIAQRGAADRMNDTAATIRSSLFQNGLSAGQNAWTSRISSMLGANGGLLNGVQQGMSGLKTGQDLATGSFAQSQAAGGVFQGQDQNVLNADKSQFDESFANRLAALQALSGIQANTTAKTSAGTMTQASDASKLGGFMSAFF